MSGTQRAFQHGLTTAAAAGGALLVMLYTHPLATPDMRARRPFLLNGADVSLLLTAAGTFTLVGLAALTVAGDWSHAALRGAAARVVLLVLLLGSGLVPALIPAAPHEAPARWRPIGWIAVGLALAMLVGRRRLRTRSRPRAA